MRFKHTLLLSVWPGRYFPRRLWPTASVQPATLKDLQTVGSTSKKQKHQQYDLVIDTSSNEYVCRTKLGSSL